jgi:hypothetical protein
LIPSSLFSPKQTQQRRLLAIMISVCVDCGTDFLDIRIPQMMPNGVEMRRPASQG